MNDIGIEIFICLLCLILGLIMGGKIMYEAGHAQAISKGYAMYHPVSGMFVWKCDYNSTTNVPVVNNIK